ncbi:hypothetical protein OR571_16190 [Psychrobacillus sp. NEAU-3TGS]|uniref:hypothetical protein n=1 Tax=Psychrobacillus sp. NEAU-3TGS TaxID=2995412 RepID=UPI002495E79D|nr:hypothetical protein [Psychrobacillus sp. NEAU-3TGS]MDI2588604.1 hypothetical protein [Psychrobacillus sp. NEAU-3TGS]
MNQQAKEHQLNELEKKLDKIIEFMDKGENHFKKNSIHSIVFHNQFNFSFMKNR